MTNIVAIIIYVLVRFPYELRDDGDGITATCTVTRHTPGPRGGTIGELNDTACRCFETEGAALLINMGLQKLENPRIR